MVQTHHNAVPDECLGDVDGAPKDLGELGELVKEGGGPAGGVSVNYKSLDYACVIYADMLSRSEVTVR